MENGADPNASFTGFPGDCGIDHGGRALWAQMSSDGELQMDGWWELIKRPSGWESFDMF